MEPIESVIDLFTAGAHWTAHEVAVGHSTAVDLATALIDRYGDRLIASPETITQFETLVLRGMAAADAIGAGVSPELADVPVLPIPTVQSRFLTQGVVNVIAPDLGTPEEPYESTVPFQTQTQTLPSLEAIAAGIATAIADSDISGSSVSASHRKAKERSRYIRSRGEAVEYDIAPFFVWRTS